MVLRASAQPYGDARSAKRAVGFLGCDDAAAGGDDHAALFGEQRQEGFTLEAAVIVLAVEGEQLRERQVGGLFDAAVQFDEGQPQPAGKAPADRGLACPTQTEQGDDRFGS